MSTITTLNSGDSGPVSRGVLNTNLANLNTDKMETSVLDTDVALTANSDAKVATQKAVKAYVDANTFSVETTAGTTHSLTTVAGQVVLVTVKGDIALGNLTSGTVSLKYNTVTKDTVVALPTYASTFPFCLQYTETPGAGTQIITVETSAGTLARVVIVVQKL